MEKKEKIRLFLLPYAGGSGLFYSHWAKFLHENIELVPLDLPGRGLRFKEPLCDEFHKAMDCVFEEMKDKLDEPYCMFGYCVGTTMVYELHKRIVEAGKRKPEHCILCANIPPDAVMETNIVNEDVEEELLNEWLVSSRLKREDMEKRNYLKNMFQVWKSDSLLMNTYYYQEPAVLFDCDLSLINGNQDKTLSSEDKEHWKKFTTKSCREYEVEGDHDFLKTNEQAIIQLINTILGNCETTLKSCL